MADLLSHKTRTPAEKALWLRRFWRDLFVETHALTLRRMNGYLTDVEPAVAHTNESDALEKVSPIFHHVGIVELSQYNHWGGLPATVSSLEDFELACTNDSNLAGMFAKLNLLERCPGTVSGVVEAMTACRFETAEVCRINSPLLDGLYKAVTGRDADGKTPFEVLDMKAAPDGFVLTFTQDLDPIAAADPGSYRMLSYTYEYHATYGSPEIESAPQKIVSAKVTGPRSIHLVIDTLRAGGEGYVHELALPGVRDAAGEPLLHDQAYYTMQKIPGRTVGSR